MNENYFFLTPFIQFRDVSFVARFLTREQVKVARDCLRKQGIAILNITTFLFLKLCGYVGISLWSCLNFVHPVNVLLLQSVLFNTSNYQLRFLNLNQLFISIPNSCLTLQLIIKLYYQLNIIFYNYILMTLVLINKAALTHISLKPSTFYDLINN